MSTSIVAGGIGVDQRQGVFVSGGTITGPVIGINQGTINYYMIEAGPAGAKLNDGPVSAIAVLDTVSIVPRPSRTFYDREDAIALVQDELRSSGGAWLTGPQGCGLTFLLRKIAGIATAAALPNGTIYLDGMTEPADLDELLRELYNYYHTASAPIAITSQAARAFLSTRRALFVLDRLPLDHDELVILADTLSQSSVLIAAEGAAPETLADIQLRGLPIADAIRLCAGIARIEVTQPEYAALIGRLCDALDGLPLPLVLAGRLLRAQVAPPAQLAAVLDELAGSGEPADREPLALAARLALQALSDDERAILAALARTNSLELSALAAISRRSLAVLEAGLKRLINLGLVSSGNERYQIASPSLRRVLDRLLPSGDQRKRAAAFFAAAAIGAPAIDLAWLSREGRNLLDAIQTLLSTGQAAQAGALAKAVQRGLVLGGQWSTWRQVIDLAGQAAQASGDQSLRAWMLHERGTHAGLLGDKTAAAVDLGEAQRMRLELGDQAGADVSLHNLRYLKLAPPGTSGRSGPERGGWVTPIIASVVVLAAVAAVWLFGGPTAANATAKTNPGQAVSVDVLSNSSGWIGGLDPASLRPIDAPGHGAASVDPRTGTIIYSPNPNFVGDDHFTFQLCSSLGRCASAGVTVSVVNRQPLAQDAAATTQPNTAVKIDALNYVKAQDGALAPQTLKIEQGPSAGAASVDPVSGMLTYTPKIGFAGDDRLSYQICDSFGGCATVGVTISVVNQPPIASDTTVSTNARTPIDINALDYVKDPDGSIDTASVKVVNAPNSGTLELDSKTGMIRYTPKIGFTGDDRFSYRACDNFGACATASVSIDVARQPLLAEDFSVPANPAAPIEIDVFKHVSDPNGTLDPAAVKTSNEGLHGTLSVDPQTGAITYTSQRGFIGADRFGYQVCDTAGNCAGATITVNVAARALVASDIKASTSANTPVVIDILKAVADPDGAIDRASLKVIDGPSAGKAEVNTKAGAVTYTPRRGFRGDDQLSYQVCDTQGSCVSAKVTISVAALLADPFAYCMAVGDLDAPDARYAGPTVPDAVATGLSNQLQLPAGRLPDNFIRWRCMGGKVFACNLGANLPCGKANTSRTPTDAMIKACKETPNAESLPAADTGHDTIYNWRCTNGTPEIADQIFKADPRGFIADFWYLIPSG
jgi:hypothetical protein